MICFVSLESLLLQKYLRNKFNKRKLCLEIKVGENGIYIRKVKVLEEHKKINKSIFMPI